MSRTFPVLRRCASLFLFVLSLVAGGAQAAAQTLTWVPTWEQKTPAGSPTSRYGAISAYDASRKEVVLFGGNTGTTVTNETSVWNGTTWIQRAPAHSPSARAGATMAYDAANSVIVLFGGNAGGTDLNDTWTWDGTDWTQRTPATAPAIRQDAAMAYDPVHGYILLFGGSQIGSGTFLQDTYRWTGTNWVAFSPATLPGRRSLASMAASPATGTVVMFGGLTSGGIVNQTWTWNGTDWTMQTPGTSPTARIYSNMAYNTALGVPVLYSGTDAAQTAAYGDTWTWSGSNWVQQTLTNTPGLAESSMAFDEATNELVVFGGFITGGPTPASNIKHDTWGLQLGSVYLGTVAAGTASAAKTLTFQAGGVATILSLTTPVNVLTQGVAGKDFSSSASTCTGTLLVGTTCTVTVQMTPAAPGLRTGVVQIQGSVTPLLASVPLSGNGTGPQAVLYPGTTTTTTTGAPAITRGLAVDPSGALYAATSTGTAKITIASNAATATAIGTTGDANGIALDGSGNLYVTTQAGAVYKETLSNGAYTQSTLTGTSVVGPGAAVDAAGNVFLVDAANSRVLRETPANGIYTESAVLTGLSSLGGIAVDAAGSLYVSSSTFVYKYTPAGGGGYTQSTVASGLSTPLQIAVDGGGNVYIANSGANNIRVAMLSAGVYTLKTISSTAGSALTVDAAGNVFIGGTAAITMVNVASPQTFTFPDTVLGVTSASQTATLTNIGNATLNLPVPGTGNNPSLSANFSVSNSSTCPQLSTSSPAAGTLLAGASCTDIVSFAPATAGSISGSLVYTDNSLNVSPATQTVNLSGTATETVTALAFVTPPAASITAGGNAGTVTVRELNGLGNTATTFSDTITLTVTYPDATTQVYTAAAASGVATFNLSGVMLTRAGPYSYVASLTGVPPVTATESLIAQTTTTITSGQNPSSAGSAVTFTATVVPIGGATGVPSGNVIFSTAGQTSQTVALGAAGMAQVTFTFPFGSTQNVNAAFQGSTYFVASSGSVSQNVKQVYNYLVTILTDDATGVALNCVAGATGIGGGNANCGLRDAIAASNAVGLAGTSAGTNITFLSSLASAATPGTVNVTTGGTLAISQPVSITGLGANALSLSGGTTAQIMSVTGAAASVSSLRLTAGKSLTVGGAVAVSGGTLTLNSDSFISNAGGNGGAVSTDGTSGILTVTNTTFATNSAILGGGAVYTATGSGGLSINNSTFSTNSSTLAAGAVSFAGAASVVRNSTFSANTSATEGALSAHAAIQVTNSIFVGNVTTATGGGGISDGAAGVNASNNVYYTNTAAGAADDCDSCSANTNPISGNPNLGALGNNGGTTQTMLPMPGSAAVCAGTVALSINSGAASNQLILDARGVKHSTGYCSVTQLDAGAVQTSYALTFTQNPAAQISSGVALVPAPSVTVQENGIAVVGASITMSLATGTLGGTTTATTGAGGVAVFNNLIVPAGLTNDTLIATLILGLAAGAPQATATSTAFSSLAVGPATLTAGTVGVAFSQTVSGSGGTAPYTYAITSGALPAGLTLTPSGANAGRIAGTPTAGGSFNFTIMATDSNSKTASLAYTLIINAPTITVTPVTLPTLTFNSAVSVPFATTGGTAPYAYIVSAGTLPAGLSLNATTGVLSGTPTAAGAYSFTIKSTDSSTGTGPYFGTVSFTGSVNKAVATVTLTNLNQTYNGSPLAPTVTTVPAGLTVNLTYNGSSTTPTNAGTYAVVATINEANYQGSTTGTLVIAKAAATVTLSNLTQTYTGSPLTPTVTTVPASLTVNLTYNGSSTTPTNAGTYAVVATINETNYQGSTTGTLVINKAVATVTLGSLTQTYTGSPLSATATTAPPGLTVNFTYNGSSTAPTAAGSYAVVGTVSDANYVGTASGTFTINKAIAPVTLGNLTPTYTGLPIAATAKTVPAGLTVTLTYNGSATAPTLAGSYAVAATVVDANYQGSATGTLVIGKATLTITAPVLTKVYGAPLPTLTGSYSGAVNGETFTVSVTTTATAASPVVIGGYPITPTVTGTTLANYNVVPVQGKLTITPATLTITAPNLSKPYGAVLPSLNGTYSGNVNGDTFTVTGSTPATSGSPVVAGGYPITPSVSGTNLSSYTVVSVPGVLTITPVTLTITAPTLSKVYGAALPSLNGTYTGNVGSDSFTVTGTTTATAASPVLAGGYPITPSVTGSNLSSYTLVTVPGVLTITPATLTITAPTLNKVYGAALPSLNGTYAGNVNGDTFTVTGSTTATAASPVVAGGYAITPLVTGSNLSNYTLVSIAGVLNITPANLTITAPNFSKAYGAPLPSLNGTYSGNVNGDTFVISGVTTATAASPVVAGGYPITPVATGANLSSYNVTAVPGVLTITPVTLTVTAPNLSKAYGANLPSLNGTYTGNVNGDTFVVNGTTTATATSPVVAGGYPITPVVSGPNLSSYTVVNVPGVLTITPAALTIVAPTLTKGYGAAVPSLAGTYSGNVTGDTFTVTGTTTATASSPVVAGGYVVTPAVTGANLSNYTVVKVNGTLTIAPANLTVTVASASKVYATPNPALTGTVTGVLLGDGITATYSTTATTASPVGAYPIVATLNDPGGKLGNYTVSNTPSTLTITPVTPGISFTAIPAAVLLGDSVTLTATLSSAAGVPTGKVNFLDGSVLIGSANLNGSGVAALSLTNLAAGAHSITAVYAGDTNFVTVTSASATVLVQDFTLNIANGTLSAQSAPLGGTATYAFSLTPSGATFPLAVTFSVSGLPVGATATFTPASIAAGSSATNVTLAVKLPATLAEVHPGTSLPFNALAPLSLALLSLPFIAWKRRKGIGATRLLGIVLLLVGGMVTALTITGCGPAANMGSGGTTLKSYTLTITATQGALSRSTTATLNVQ